MLHSIRQQILETQQWPQDWKRSVFIPTPKKGNAKEYSNYCKIVLISHTSKVLLKIPEKHLLLLHWLHQNLWLWQFVDHHKLWEILQEMGIPKHLTCLLRNLDKAQEATVRTRHGKTDCFQIRKGVHQGCILSPRYLTSMQSKSWKMPGWWSTSWNQDC